MVSPSLVSSDVFSFPRPTSFTQPESDEAARGRTLKELVWDKIPNRLRHYPLHDEFKPLVEKFNWDGVSWVLFGPTGSGKTTACVHLVRELLRRGKVNGGADFERAKGIFWTRADAVISAGEDKTDQGAKLLHRAEFSKLMILDDVASSGKALTRVMQARYDNARPVIVTSGALNAGDFSKMAGGDAIVRWFLECGAQRGMVLNAAGTRAKADVRPLSPPTPGTTPTPTRQTTAATNQRCNT